MKKIVFVAAAVALLGGCAVPGTVSFVYEDGRWRPDKAVFNRADITEQEVQHLQDRLNGE